MKFANPTLRAAALAIMVLAVPACETGSSRQTTAEALTAILAERAVVLVTDG